MSEQWKMIYLARRNPALAAEDFPRAWREHSALGSQCHNVRDKVLGVTQCARILDAAGALPGASTDYDGVNLLRLRDRAVADDIWDDEETLRIMRPDEPRVFSGYVRDFTVTCRERVLHGGQPGEVCAQLFLRARADLEREALAAQCEALAADDWLAQTALASARHLVLNRVCGDCPAGYEFAAVLECWFDDLAALATAFAAAPVWRQLPASIASQLDRAGSVAMLTRVSHRKP